MCWAPSGFKVCEAFPLGVEPTLPWGVLGRALFQRISCFFFCLSWVSIAARGLSLVAHWRLDLNSPTGDRTCVRRQTLNHWTTREVPGTSFLYVGYPARLSIRVGVWVGSWRLDRNSLSPPGHTSSGACKGVGCLRLGSDWGLSEGVLWTMLRDRKAFK